MAQSKIIISCAVTGSIHTPSMSEYLPLTPDEIATQAIEAAEAGAAILHLHAREPADGKPTADPEVFMQFLPRIKQATDAVINISTGGGQHMTVAERMMAAEQTAPEMASLNMGSMNFGLFPALERYSSFKHPWERTFLENSEDFVFKNTFKDIAYILETLGKGQGTRFEFECYDVGHLYSLRHFADRGLIEPPYFIQFVLGVLGGIGPDPENLVHLKRMADKLFGDTYVFSVLGAGRHQIPLVTQAALLGGNVRVGLEDSLYLAKGVLAKSNAEQVHLVRSILESLSLEVATPSEARDILKLKGGDTVRF